MDPIGSSGSPRTDVWAGRGAGAGALQMAIESNEELETPGKGQGHLLPAGPRQGIVSL